MSFNETPVIARRAPLPVDVQAGEAYWWCAGGRSNTRPFCDGSHKGSSFSPIEYKATETRKALFGACKRSGKKPLCLRHA